MSKAPEGVEQRFWDLASKNAGLGVGHIWTETRCPAYRTFNPADCTCHQPPEATK